MAARWQEVWLEEGEKPLYHWEKVDDGLHFFRTLFRQVSDSPFLLGYEGDGCFRADLEWLMREKNHLKLREGRWRQAGR